MSKRATGWRGPIETAPRELVGTQVKLDAQIYRCRCCLHSWIEVWRGKHPVRCPSCWSSLWWRGFSRPRPARIPKRVRALISLRRSPGMSLGRLETDVLALAEARKKFGIEEVEVLSGNDNESESE
jgi:hypothetical protein